jgi:hypothetical protein
MVGPMVGVWDVHVRGLTFGGRRGTTVGAGRTWVGDSGMHHGSPSSTRHPLGGPPARISGHDER